MNLLNLIIYIFKSYPKVNELSKPRLVKIIYLIDWKYAIETGSQYTEIEWYYNHYGPYVDDVINLIKNKSDLFLVRSTVNQFGSITDKISLKQDIEVDMQEDIKSSADFIVKNTHKMNWSEFIDLVYSTFPVLSNPQYTILDLSKDAKKFNLYKSHKRV